MIGIYHYKTLKQLYETVWKDAFKKSDVSNLIAINKKPYYLVKRGLYQYIIDQYDSNGIDVINHFPMVFTKTDQTFYKKEVYYHVEEYTPLKLHPQKTMEFQELVMRIAPFEHSSPNDFLLMKLIVMSSLLYRTNTVISTQAGFGKDSLTDIMGMFIPEISNFTPNSMASIVYRLENKLIAINEVTDLKAEELQMLELFLSTAGSFANQYENPKRGNSAYGTKDIFDISKLSLGIYFNTYEYFLHKNMDKKFFDNVFKDHIHNRFCCFRFDGYLKEDFSKEPVTITNAQVEEYKEIAKNIKYWQVNCKNIDFPYASEFEDLFKDKKFSIRHKTTLYAIAKTVWLFTQDKAIWSKYMLRLRDCINAYHNSKKLTNMDIRVNDFNQVQPMSVDDLNALER